MTSRDNELSLGSVGQSEPRPTLVTFHGFVHHPLNVQGFLRHIKPAVVEHLSHTPGKTTILLEASTNTPGIAQWTHKFAEKHGYAGLGIADILREQGLLATDQFIRKRAQELSLIDLETNLQSAFDRRLITTKFARCILTYQFLDSLKEVFNFEVIEEQHPGDTVKQLNNLSAMAQKYVDAAKDEWDNRDFSAALRNYGLFRVYRHQRSRIREPDIVDILKKKTIQGNSTFTLM